MRYTFLILLFLGCGETSFLPSSDSNKKGDSSEAPSIGEETSQNKDGVFGDGTQVLKGNIDPLQPLLYNSDGTLKLGFDSKGCESLKGANLDGVGRYTPNFVTDGNFESESSDFQSSYTYNSLSSCVDTNSLQPGIGQYSIVTDPNRCHRAWDKLEGSKMAIFNGAVGSQFWCREFDILPGVKYAFSVRERLLHPDGGANSSAGSSPIQWTFNSEEVLAPSTPIQEWRTRGVIWSSDTLKKLTVCGVNNSSNNSGNDWAIDDICLVPQAIAE